MTRPMFPHTVDSTMLATFRSCPHKFYRQYVQHWKPKGESVHLIAGAAFAKGIEVARKAFYEGLEFKGFAEDGSEVYVYNDALLNDRESAEALGLSALLHAYGDFEAPQGSAKTAERTAGALEFYFANYPFGQDGMTPVELAGGRRGIEFSFAEPLPIAHPITGDPILYTGRTDMIAEFANGVYVVDEKTTSSLGASWGRQWEMRAQFTGYCWACRVRGIKPAGTIVRGVSILKTKYDTQQIPTYRADWEIDRWLEQTVRDLQRMIAMWKSGWWDFALDHACGEYGGCSMLQVCKSNDPDSWLPMYFEQRVWDPLARKELTVEEWEASWGHNPPGLSSNNPLGIMKGTYNAQA